jgi:Na+-driven multidrug efflux pump
MKVFFSIAMAIGLSYKYYHDFKNSNTFIMQYSGLFHYVVGFIVLVVGVCFYFFHSYVASVYTSDDTLDSGVDSVVLLYPFFFLLECLICIFDQEANIRKKKHKKCNYYGLIMNCLAIIIFSPIAGLIAFYWEFSYGGIWICYFEFLVFKFIVYLIINLFKF